MTRALAIIAEARRWIPWAGLAALCLILAAKCQQSADMADKAKQAQEQVRLELESLLAENQLLAAQKMPGKPVAVARAVARPVPAAAPVAIGERLTLKVDEVLLRTTAGNHVLVGTVSAQNESGTLVARAPFTTPVTSAFGIQESRMGWGAGPFAVAAPGGWAAGASVVAPPLRLFGLSIEASAGVGFGTLGPVAMGQVVVRP